MMKRFGRVAAMLAVLAVAVLLFRPALLDVAGVPHGAHFSPQVQLAYAQGSPHCGLLADCETISISNMGIALPTALLVLPAGAFIALLVLDYKVAHSWTARVPNRPPLPALS